MKQLSFFGPDVSPPRVAWYKPKKVKARPPLTSSKPIRKKPPKPEVFICLDDLDDSVDDLFRA